MPEKGHETGAPVFAYKLYNEQLELINEGETELAFVRSDSCKCFLLSLELTPLKCKPLVLRHLDKLMKGDGKQWVNPLPARVLAYDSDVWMPGILSTKAEFWHGFSK